MFSGLGLYLCVCVCVCVCVRESVCERVHARTHARTHALALGHLCVICAHFLCVVWFLLCAHVCVPCRFKINLPKGKAAELGSATGLGKQAGRPAEGVLCF